jgi:hypothetical protein
VEYQKNKIKEEEEVCAKQDTSKEYERFRMNSMFGQKLLPRQ